MKNALTFTSHIWDLGIRPAVMQIGLSVCVNIVTNLQKLTNVSQHNAPRFCITVVTSE